MSDYGPRCYVAAVYAVHSAEIIFIYEKPWRSCLKLRLGAPGVRSYRRLNLAWGVVIPSQER